MKLHYKSILLIPCLIILFVYGCDIYDDNSDCPQGLNISLYSKTPCMNNVIYPEDIQMVDYYVFDDKGVLVASQRNNQVELQEDYIQTLSTGSGIFSVVAWAGLNSDLYDIASIQPRAMSKESLTFRLKREEGQAVPLENNTLYYGESPTVFIQDPKDVGSVFESVTINMREITNRITVIVEGLPNPADYEVEIEDANGSMNMDGSITEDDILMYNSPTLVRDGYLQSEFTLLKLETGYHDTLIIKSKSTGRELYRGNLLGTLLLKNPDVNLACDHDFTIRFTTRDVCECGTYIITSIWVNNWLVHSYDTELE